MLPCCEHTCRKCKWLRQFRILTLKYAPKLPKITKIPKLRCAPENINEASIDQDYATENLSGAPKNQYYVPDNLNYAPKAKITLSDKYFRQFNCQLSTRMIVILNLFIIWGNWTWRGWRKYSRTHHSFNSSGCRLRRLPWQMQSFLRLLLLYNAGMRIRCSDPDTDPGLKVTWDRYSKYYLISCLDNLQVLLFVSDVPLMP